MTESKRFDRTSARWFKSTRSNGGGNCVEASHTGDGGMAIRDSKNPDGAILIFNAHEWGAFVDGLKGGEFDS